jgi:hypothetical protein|nr:MAG TPA: hypothetical protein [Microviridae sp.]
MKKNVKNPDDVLSDAVRGCDSGRLPATLITYGAGFKEGVFSLQIPLFTESEIDLSVLVPGCNYKLQIVPLCPTEEKPADLVGVVSE